MCEDGAMEMPYAVVRLGQVEATEEFGGTLFKPVRTLLGIEAFGVAAWVGDAGETVVGEHSEADDGQEEMYAVLSGRALFVIEGEELTAEAGTCVAVRAGVRRSARAEADGTEVLAVGSFRGKPYVGPGWEHAAAAAPEYRRGDYEGAAATLLAALQEHPDTVGVLYNLACCEALLGRGDAALGHLEQALAIQPGLLAHAHVDSDLDSIRADPRFPARG
jgi:mannose-6-phosphate isomerase-like protein (cupin superfamily)